MKRVLFLLVLSVGVVQGEDGVWVSTKAHSGETFPQEEEWQPETGGPHEHQWEKSNYFLEHAVTELELLSRNPEMEELQDLLRRI